VCWAFAVGVGTPCSRRLLLTWLVGITQEIHELFDEYREPSGVMTVDSLQRFLGWSQRESVGLETCRKLARKLAAETLHAGASRMAKKDMRQGISLEMCVHPCVVICMRACWLDCW